MAAKFTYEINFGSGYVATELYNCQLILVNRRNESFLGIVDTYLEGSFDLLGDDFDDAIAAFSAYGYITLDVYLGLSVVKTSFCYDLCDLDYNQKKCTIKNFSKYNANSIRYYWNKNFVIEGTNDLFEFLGTQITAYAAELIPLIEAKFTALGVLEAFDSADYWFDTGLTTIDFDDLRIASMRDMYNAGSTGIIGGQRKSITLLKLFDCLCQMFNITITIVDNQVYFKKHTDFIDNSLDLSAVLVNKKIRNYDLTKLYKAEVFKFSDNNQIDDDVDNVNCELTYNYAGDILEHDLSEFTTFWNFSDEISGDGWFIGKVTLGEILDPVNGYVSGLSKKNADLFPANLLNNYYRDWISTDKKYFSVCGNPSASAPSYFRNFIEISEIEYTLADPSVFYDSIILETDVLKQRIGLVMEQSTNLNTNITKFISYEFFNDIDT